MNMIVLYTSMGILIYSLLMGACLCEYMFLVGEDMDFSEITGKQEFYITVLCVFAPISAIVMGILCIYKANSK